MARAGSPNRMAHRQGLGRGADGAGRDPNGDDAGGFPALCGHARRPNAVSARRNRPIAAPWRWKKSMKTPKACPTQWHKIVAYLHQQRPNYLPTHKLQSINTDFGFIGSSGEQRVRELARNDACIPP